MWITFKFSELWFIFCLRQPKSIKSTFQATKFKVEENSRNFQRLPQTFKDFSKKNGIQELFKDFPNCAPAPWKLIYWSWVQWSLKVPWGVSLAMTYLVQTHLPSSKDINKEISSKLCWQHLGDDIDVGHKSALQVKEKIDKYMWAVLHNNTVTASPSIRMQSSEEPQ